MTHGGCWRHWKPAMIDLNPNHLGTVKAILAEHVPECEVWAFGSRATWTAKDYSDLDLAVVGEGPLDWRTLGRLKESFEESDLPMRVDVLDWYGISESFREVIERDYVAVQEGSKDRRVDALDEWTHCTLAEACSAINYGLTASASDHSDGPKFLRITDIVSGPPNWKTVPHVEADDDTIAKYQLCDGDIVIARTGASTGTSAYIRNPPPSVFASYLVRLQARPEFDSRFLAYYLKSKEFNDFMRGVLGDKSAQPNASASTMTSAPFKAPKDKAEQQAIAHVLGTLDDKIELNRRMNETLESMARALFKSWFVDFDPVRAKMEGRWRRGESLPGLPTEYYDLFPDRLVDSELGEIPEGWKLRAFGTLLDDVIGGDWGKETPDVDHTEPVSIIRGTDLSALAEGGSGSVPLRFTTKKKAERRMLKDGDIIIEVSGGSPTQSTGRSLMMTRDVLRRFPGTVVCASFCRRFHPNSWRHGLLASRHLDFLHSTGKMWDYQLQSTGIANFQTTRFLKEEMAIWPGEPLLTTFAEIVGPIVRQTSRNENMILAAQRETLLPKLASGEVRVAIG